MNAAPVPRPPAEPPPAEPPLDKGPEAIRGMFARVAPAYDLLNHLLSGSLDHLWRWRAARALALGGPRARPALDLCCGTGDQAIALHRRGARVAAADFCLPMVTRARHKFARRRRARAAAPPPAPLVADALTLPFAAGSFGAATVSFGLRNVVDLDAALAELARVLAKGGELAVLEFAVPRFAPLRALYLFYFRRLLPRIGRWISGDRGAYSYLPSSVLAFPQRDGFVERLWAAGFGDGVWQDLSGGVLCLYTARRAA
ncbi:MAG TPA: ubiquinone/menaquinone biosynthesis methyltransferase [Thermoanaerobaculia bacterium]|nr:ubiquinone/menaquinone biosynthesis methyltransferase [Thermoanaerobaculia bacterium]